MSYRTKSKRRKYSKKSLFQFIEVNKITIYDLTHPMQLTYASDC